MSNPNAAPLVRATRSTHEHPRSTKSTPDQPCAPQDPARIIQARTQGVHTNTYERSNPFKLNSTCIHNRAKKLPKVNLTSVAGFLVPYDTFDPNGSRLGPFDSNGLMFEGCPGKTPTAKGGLGEGNLPPFSALNMV